MGRLPAAWPQTRTEGGDSRSRSLRTSFFPVGSEALQVAAQAPQDGSVLVSGRERGRQAESEAPQAPHPTLLAAAAPRLPWPLRQLQEAGEGARV